MWYDPLVSVFAVGGCISPSQDQPLGGKGPEETGDAHKGCPKQPSPAELFKLNMAEFDELKKNPTSKFCQEVGEARERLPKPLPGILVAPGVRGEVCQKFPVIDDQLELLQAELAHAVVYSRIPALESHPRALVIKDMLRACLSGVDGVPVLLDAVREDLARFVYPNAAELIEEDSLPYDQLLATAARKLDGGAQTVKPSELVDAILTNLGVAEGGLAELERLYRADMKELLAGADFSNISEGAQHIQAMHQRRLERLRRPYSIMTTEMKSSLRALRGKLAPLVG